jgi:hypothetical protein
MRTLITPYGGKLSILYLSGNALEAERQRAIAYPSWSLTERQVCDIELLMNGALSPLSGFMHREEYERVVRDMRLPNGLAWPIPIVLDVSKEFAERLATGEWIALRDREGIVVATMKVEVKWTPDRELEAREVYGTTDTAHPGVFHLAHRTNPVYIGGPVPNRGPRQGRENRRTQGMDLAVSNGHFFAENLPLIDVRPCLRCKRRKRRYDYFKSCERRWRCWPTQEHRHLLRDARWCLRD